MKSYSNSIKVNIVFGMSKNPSVTTVKTSKLVCFLPVMVALFPFLPAHSHLGSQWIVFVLMHVPVIWSSRVTRYLHYIYCCTGSWSRCSTRTLGLCDTFLRVPRYLHCIYCCAGSWSRCSTRTLGLCDTILRVPRYLHCIYCCAGSWSRCSTRTLGRCDMILRVTRYLPSQRCCVLALAIHGVIGALKRGLKLTPFQSYL